MDVLAAGERGTHREQVDLPQVDEPGRAHRRGDLRVDRNDGRPRPVSGGGEELGVAQRVPGVAVNSPVLRLVAEYCQAGRVLPRAWRLGASGPEGKLPPRPG